VRWIHLLLTNKYGLKRSKKMRGDNGQLLRVKTGIDRGREIQEAG
jgi:hypothetical protein